MSIPFARRSFPEIYEQELVDPLFRPFAEDLLDTVAPALGERLLDVACGTGIVARLARRRVGANGRVVGVDVAPPMLAVARSVAPEVDWREGDASLSLPLVSGEAFDVVTCHQGLQFFADRAAGLREMRSALGSGGRLGVATWLPDEGFPLLRELRRVAERHVGPIVDRRHGLGDARELEALLRDAGFRDVRSTTATHTVRFEDGLTFVRLNAMAMVGMSAGAKAMSDEERARHVENIVDSSAELVARASDANGMTYEIGANVATAVR